jgi:ribosomal protein S7
MQKTLSDKIQEYKKSIHNIIPELKTGNINTTNIQVLVDIENFLEECKMKLSEIRNQI